MSVIFIRIHWYSWKPC